MKEAIAALLMTLAIALTATLTLIQAGVGNAGLCMFGASLTVALIAAATHLIKSSIKTKQIFRITLTGGLLALLMCVFLLMSLYFGF